MKVVVAGRVSPAGAELVWADCEAAEPDGAEGVCPLLPP
jgi:hypothetical protein